MNIFSFFKNFLNKRKHKRYYTHTSAYLIVQPFTPDEKKVQIIDISNGGCAFIYEGSKSDLAQSGFFNLVNDDSLHLEQLQYATRSDKPLTQSSRRRGVEFKWLGTRNKEELKKFVDSVSICSC